jgi:RimJ/RimL family protein N-acetyltransferase
VSATETDRLLLEPLTESRFEEFCALMSDPEATRYWSPYGAFERDRSRRNFDAALARIEEHGFGRRWVVSKETGSGLGFTEVKHFGSSCAEVSPDEVEIGWMLTPSAWGRGYGTEAGRAARDEAFELLPLESLVAVHHPENAASARIMEKLGMEVERDVVDRTGWPYRLHRLMRERWKALQ